MLTKIVPRYPALMINGTEKSLIITDLHLGFEAKLSSNNIYLGKNTSITETTKDIEKILDKTKPELLIMLGDIKSGIKSITKTEWNTIPTFFETIKKRIDVIIMGHIHPVFFEEKSLLNGKRVWVSLKSKKQKIFPSRTGELEIIILPSFNRYFYATQKKKYKKSTSPIIERMETLQAKIVDLDGTIIGNESLLSQVI